MSQVLVLLAVVVAAVALDASTLFFEVRTDIGNDQGNLSLFSLDLATPTQPPALVTTMQNVPGGRAAFGVDPVREYVYFSSFANFDAKHSGTLFGRFKLSSPQVIEHLVERTDNEPGGLRVAAGARFGITYFVTCLTNSSAHSSIVLSEFDNGDLDVKTVLALSTREIDDKACRIPVAYKYDDPQDVFLGGSK